ncbi:hypothetical protein BHE74_00053917 [Ensete ventricosum]|nr:hypothetical protein BHE74_00053917 [Ensete ventricosum]
MRRRGGGNPTDEAPFRLPSAWPWGAQTRERIALFSSRRDERGNAVRKHSEVGEGMSPLLIVTKRSDVTRRSPQRHATAAAAQTWVAARLCFDSATNAVERETVQHES